MFFEESVKFIKYGGLGFARDGPAVDFDAATVGHDVGLAAAFDYTDVDAGVTEQRMFSLV